MKAELIRERRFVSESQLRYDLMRYINQFSNKKRVRFIGRILFGKAVINFIQKLSPPLPVRCCGCLA
ncbi:MAG: hypothetical protein KUG76_02745 [Gammaproteobacteria bacterium]|nr:hypothetical protein [Gammaproteobacteria bacterium]